MPEGKGLKEGLTLDETVLLRGAEAEELTLPTAVLELLPHRDRVAEEELQLLAC